MSNSGTDVVKTVVQKVTPGLIVRFLNEANSDAASPIVKLFSEAAIEHANTITNIENFFAEYQNFKKAQQCEVSAQEVVSCILHHVRASEVRQTTYKLVVKKALSTFTAKTLFSVSLENLYHLTVLLAFEAAVSLRTLAEQIIALTALHAEIEGACEKVDRNQSEKLSPEAKAAFSEGLVRISSDIMAHIDQLELKQHMAPIINSLNDILIHTKDVNKSLIRTLQYLHAPATDFVPLDMLHPGFKNPWGNASKTRDALVAIAGIPSGLSLFEIDSPRAHTIQPVETLHALVIPLEKVASGLSKIYGTQAKEFARIIRETYTIQHGVRNFIRIHETMIAGAHAFGEIMLANAPVLKAVMQRHLKLMAQILAGVDDLYTRIDSRIIYQNSHATSHKFTVEHMKLSKLNLLIEAGGLLIAERLGRLSNHNYLHSFLTQFIECAIEGARMLRQFGGDCSDSELAQLVGMQQGLRGTALPNSLVHVDKEGQVLAVTGTRYSPENFIDGVISSSGDNPGIPVFTSQPSASARLSQDEVHPAELINGRDRRNSHSSTISTASLNLSIPVDVLWQKIFTDTPHCLEIMNACVFNKISGSSKEAIAAKQALTNFITDKISIPQSNKKTEQVLTKENFENFPPGEVQTLYKLILKVCDVSKDASKKALILQLKDFSDVVISGTISDFTTAPPPSEPRTDVSQAATAFLEARRAMVREATERLLEKTL